MSRDHIWKSAHLTIDGVLIDRDNGWPELELEMVPLGTQLPPEQQGRELHIRIGSEARGKKTVLDEEGIKVLAEFLTVSLT